MAAQAMVSASTGAMNSVLLKLATLLEDEHNPRTRNSIIALRCALASMRSFLERRATSTEDLGPAHEKHHRPKVCAGWMKQVRDMTFDLEDCIDDFMCSAALGDTNCIWYLNHRAAQLLKMLTWRRQTQYMSLLQELKEQVCEASERRWRYGIVCDLRDPMCIPSDAVPIDGLLPVFSAYQGGGLVCVEGQRDRLIKLLASDDQEELKMVLVVGSRGIGKTTLVMEVYESLKERFHSHTVVSVSRHHDLRMILISIISQIGVQEHDFRECDEEQLIYKLHEFLKTKRYLIVIEDIWDVSAWKIIRWAFPENHCGSRILVTTCIISIASPSCYFNEDHIFRMAPLIEVDARRLFLRRVFHPEYCCPLNLEEISSDILKKCGGVPLAIIIIASLLATKPEESEWKKVREDIVSIVDKSATAEGIKQILHFAYFDLPFHLRTCLLYLTVFPEGYVIDKAQLIRRWMAEGFITEEHGKSSEEVGEIYFIELINRGLIQPVCIQYDGRVEACQVQNMILDIILSKSAEENFVTRYDGRGCSFGVQNKIRRLSLYCDYDKECSFIPSAATASHIRSLIIFMTGKEMPSLANFRALRVLDLEITGELKDANYLQNIRKQCLLKYLRLQTTRFIELPEQVGELQFLQTIDLSCALITRLPCSIVRLNLLTYLLVKNVKLPDEIGKLQVLQELSHVEVESSNSPNSLEELGRLTMLRVLGLNWCISDTDTCMKVCANSLISSLDKLGTSNLQSLHIAGGSGCSLEFLLDSLSAPFKHLHEFRMTSDYYFPRIPEWMSSLVSLKLLEINISIVREETLYILEKLPSLLVLLLSVKSVAPSQRLIIRSGGFQRLQKFDFICLNCLDMMVFEQGSMLALEKLHLKFRVKGVFVYQGFQFGIEYIASLRYLHVDIDCKDADAREVEAAENAIRGAIRGHPGNPRLELRRLEGEDAMMGEMEITVHGEGAEGHNDVESEDMVEEELVSPDVSPWWLVHTWWVISVWWIASAWGIISTWVVISAWWIPSVYSWWVVSNWWLVSPWCISPLWVVPTLWVVSSKWWLTSRILPLFFVYAYPAYKCYRTVELKKPKIEQLIFWCQYWILVALMTGLENCRDLTISWVPFYSEAKLMFFIYLWYPRKKGTTYIYGTFFRPYISQHQNGVDRILLDFSARASNAVGFYFRAVGILGQNAIVKVLNYAVNTSQKQHFQEFPDIDLVSEEDWARALKFSEALKELEEDRPRWSPRTMLQHQLPRRSDDDIRRLIDYLVDRPVSTKIKVEASSPPIAGDTREALKDLVQSMSVAEQDLLADSSRVADRCGKTCKGKAEYLRAVANGLRSLGYDAAVCRSRWDNTPSYPAGEHEYIETVVGGEMRLIVEVDFRSEFKVARTAREYQMVLQVLPWLFVGTPDRLEHILAIVAEAAQQSFKDKRLPLRINSKYMRTKWLSPHVRTD